MGSADFLHPNLFEGFDGFLFLVFGFREKMRAADATFRQGMAQIQEQLTLVAQEIATERKLDIVLAKATIVLVRPELEITDAALALLNQRMPRVRLPGLGAQSP